MTPTPHIPGAEIAELLPCPFCGGVGEYQTDTEEDDFAEEWIGCTSCGATTALTVWNRLAAKSFDVGDAVDAEAKALRAKVHRDSAAFIRTLPSNQSRVERLETRETAWLVERTDLKQPEWWSPGPPAGDYADANVAMRFARQQDAETFIRLERLDPAAYRATEHIFIQALGDRS